MTEGGYSVDTKKIIMVLGCLCLTLLVCGGCGLTFDKSHYAYLPGEKLDNDIKPLPVIVAINKLEDLRGRERKEYLPLIILTFVPYAYSHFDRPETSEKFTIKGLNPSVDFANALLQEMKQNNFFSDVSMVQQNYSNNADLIVTGKIYQASIDTKITAYVLSIFGIFPWIAGLPQGKVYNELNVQYEMRRTYDNAVVWKCEVKGVRNKFFALFNNYSKDDPYTGMNEILRKSLRDGLSVLAEDIKHKPLEYWKH